MPRIQPHGGGCCGIRHYSGFWSSQRLISTESITTELNQFPMRNTRNGRGKCIEAVITDSQFAADPQLAQKLKDNGFRLVTRFYNSTGGMCNILHRVNAGGRDLSRVRNRHVRLLMEE